MAGSGFGRWAHTCAVALPAPPSTLKCHIRPHPQKAERRRDSDLGPMTACHCETYLHPIFFYLFLAGFSLFVSVAHTENRTYSHPCQAGMISQQQMPSGLPSRLGSQSDIPSRFRHSVKLPGSAPGLLHLGPVSPRLLHALLPNQLPGFLWP